MQECLGGLPTLERIGITMSESFRLYVAAYQHRHVWKEVWKLIKPILSVQIIKDVEHFVSMRPMDCQSMVSIVRYGTCKPPAGSDMHAAFWGILPPPPSVIASDSNSTISPSDSASVASASMASRSVMYSNVDITEGITEANVFDVGSNRHAALALAASRTLQNVRRSRSTHKQIQTSRSQTQPQTPVELPPVESPPVDGQVDDQVDDQVEVQAATELYM